MGMKNAKALMQSGKAAIMVTLTSLAALNYHAIAATATLPLIARFVRAIEITINTSLDFGTLAMTIENTGQATLDPLTDRLFIDKSSALVLAGGKPRAGRIRIKGDPGRPVTVSIADAVVTLTNGTTFVIMDNFNLISDQAGSRITITPGGALGTVEFAVGATVHTREGQISGTYTGENKIFANYQ